MKIFASLAALSILVASPALPQSGTTDQSSAGAPSAVAELRFSMKPDVAVYRGGATLTLDFRKDDKGRVSGFISMISSSPLTRCTLNKTPIAGEVRGEWSVFRTAPLPGDRISCRETEYRLKQSGAKWTGRYKTPFGEGTLEYLE